MNLKIHDARMRQNLIMGVRYFKRELVNAIQTYEKNAGLSDIRTMTIAVKCENVCLFDFILFIAQSYGIIISL